MAIDIPDRLLTEEHLVQINDGLAAIGKVRKHIEQAERAGLNMADTRKVVDDQEKQLRSFKQVYFPGR